MGERREPVRGTELAPLQRPIGMRGVHLASKTMHFKGCFQRLGRLRAIESIMSDPTHG